MEYILQTNENGELNGTQRTLWYINNHYIQEVQKFDNGEFVPEIGFVSVHINGWMYDFDVENWGSISYARDAAEMFARGDFLWCVESKNHMGYFDVLPKTEEAEVLHA